MDSKAATDGPANIIYPPLDIKTIADKTAEHVAKSGEAFQQLIRDKYQGNNKFSFIYPNDPYFAYYQHMVDKFKSGATSKDTTKGDAGDASATADEANEDEAVEAIPERPEPIQFAFPMPAISAQDLDVIKLTAQFVAANGRQFMTSLAQREANNYQFDFLSPNHTLFGYFRRLVDQYSLILFPPDDLTRGLERDQEDKYQILDRINRRMKWEAYEEEERKKREEEAAKEKEAYLSIDWHDFVVVGAVEFVEEDVYVDLPEPLKLQDLTNMSLEDKRKAKAEGSSAGEDAGASKGNAGASEEEHAIEDMDQEEDEDNDVEMEMDEDDEDDEDIDEEIEAERNPNAPAAVTVQPSAISVGPMKIRKDYVPNLRRGPQTSEVTLQCQLCKLEIPASEFEEHIRVELIDPKWKEQKLIYERKIRDSNLVQEGMDIAKYLGQMAAHRSNISSGNERPEEDEEAASASANASTQNRVYWDGYSSSAGQATRRARENMSVDEQIAAIHHKKGVAGPNGSTPEIGPQTGPPAAKRQRTSQDQ